MKIGKTKCWNIIRFSADQSRMNKFVQNKFNSMPIKTLKNVWDTLSSANTDSVWCKGVHYQTTMFVSITIDHSFQIFVRGAVNRPH